MTPSPRLLVLMTVALPIAALPIVVDPRLWVVQVAAWVALGIALVWELSALVPARARAGVSVEPRVGVGDPVRVRLRLELGGRRTLPACMRTETDLPLLPGDDLFTLLPPGPSEHELELSAPRRGEGCLRAAWLRVEGPLGLLRRIDRIALDAEPIAVVPSLRRVRNLAFEHLGASGLQGGVHVVRPYGTGSELDALNAYVHGMDLRSVDWKSTARHQSLVVRRYRAEKNQRVVLCLDKGRLMGDPIDGLERLDHGVHAALLVAFAALRAGDLVGLFAYGAAPERWLPPRSGLGHLDRLREAAAGLSVEAAETNHFLGLRDLLGRLKRRSLVIVFTEFTDATSAELMIENLAQLAERHLVVFVALDDPAVEAPLGRKPRGLDDVAEAVVAGDLRDDRGRVLLRLRRSGVDVVHGPPHRATLDLVARYVSIKRKGRLG